MSVETNKLVARAGKIAFPLGILASAALGTVLVTNHDSARAAMSSYAEPLTTEQVAPLVSLDQAMETLTARVEPAVVNVAVTSRGTPDEDNQQGNSSQQQGGNPAADRARHRQRGHHLAKRLHPDQ
jgi:serine protease Do